MSKRVSVTVDVEVWLDDIDTDDLLEELSTRGDLASVASAAGVPATPPLSSEERHPLHEIYYALKFGLTEKACDLMRSHINNELGTAL